MNPKLYTDLLELIRDIRKDKRGFVTEYLPAEPTHPKDLVIIRDDLDREWFITHREWFITHGCLQSSLSRLEKDLGPTSEVLKCLKNNRGMLYNTTVGVVHEQSEGTREFLDLLDAGKLGTKSFGCCRGDDDSTTKYRFATADEAIGVANGGGIWKSFLEPTWKVTWDEGLVPIQDATEGEGEEPLTDEEERSVALGGLVPFTPEEKAKRVREMRAHKAHWALSGLVGKERVKVLSSWLPPIFIPGITLSNGARVTFDPPLEFNTWVVVDSTSKVLVEGGGQNYYLFDPKEDQIRTNIELDLKVRWEMNVWDYFDVDNPELENVRVKGQVQDKDWLTSRGKESVSLFFHEVARVGGTPYEVPIRVVEEGRNVFRLRLDTSKVPGLERAGISHRLGNRSAEARLYAIRELRKALDVKVQSLSNAKSFRKGERYRHPTMGLGTITCDSDTSFAYFMPDTADLTPEEQGSVVRRYLGVVLYEGTEGGNLPQLVRVTSEEEVKAVPAKAIPATIEWQGVDSREPVSREPVCITVRAGSASFDFQATLEEVSQLREKVSFQVARRHSVLTSSLPKWSEATLGQHDGCYTLSTGAGEMTFALPKKKVQVTPPPEAVTSWEVPVDSGLYQYFPRFASKEEAEYLAKWGHCATPFCNPSDKPVNAKLSWSMYEPTTQVTRIFSDTDPPEERPFNVWWVEKDRADLVKSTPKPDESTSGAVLLGALGLASLVTALVSAGSKSREPLVAPLSLAPEPLEEELEGGTEAQSKRSRDC